MDKNELNEPEKIFISLKMFIVDFKFSIKLSFFNKQSNYLLQNYENKNTKSNNFLSLQEIL